MSCIIQLLSFLGWGAGYSTLSSHILVQFVPPIVQERDLVAKILAALGSTDDDDSEAEATEGGKKENLAVPHLLGILQMEGNLTAQKAAAQQLAKEVRRAFTHISLVNNGIAVMMGCFPQEQFHTSSDGHTDGKGQTTKFRALAEISQAADTVCSGTSRQQRDRVTEKLLRYLTLNKVLLGVSERGCVAFHCYFTFSGSQHAVSCMWLRVPTTVLSSV